MKKETSNNEADSKKLAPPNHNLVSEVYSKKHFGWKGRLRRFLITNKIAYRIVVFLRIKQIKNFFENLFNNKKEKNLYISMLSSIARQPSLTGFTVDIVSHCNLNCKFCSHFSPLVKEKYISMETFTKDLERMSELTGKVAGDIRLMGGEPLLHPQLLDFVVITRKLFPNSEVLIVTNGILLPRQDDTFWKTLRDNNVIIYCSRYPINIDFSSINSKAAEFGVRIDYVGLQFGLKTMYYSPLDLSGKQDAKVSYIKCGGGNSDCSKLADGKLFTCAIPATARFFNEYFGKNIEITDRDYIDIYKAKNIDEILDFLCRPIPFCRYCNVDARTGKNKWGISKREITEWI
jgi:hypothetical protein